MPNVPLPHIYNLQEIIGYFKYGQGLGILF